MMIIDEIPGDVFQWLRGFYYVATKGSVTDAAAAMGRGQPTVTRQIKCLEKELGVALFDRSSGKMKITAEGKALLKRAISLFEDVRGIRNEFRPEYLEYEGRIIIAASTTIINSFLSPYIKHFRDTHPRVSFHVEGGFSETVFERVESGEVDFGISVVNSVPRSLTCHDLFEAGQKLIARKKNPYFTEKTPTLRQIAQAPLILFSRTGAIESFIEKRFNDEGLNLNVAMTSNNFITAKEYVALGVGVAILTGYSVTEQDKKKLAVYSLDRYFPKRTVGLLLKKKRYLTPSVKNFIHSIKPDIPLE